MTERTQLGLFDRPAPDKLQAAWEEAKAEQPWLLPALADLAKEAIRRGHSRWSADALFHVLRWETSTTTGDQAPRVNNNFSALAARDLMASYPELDGLFELRIRKPRGSWGQVH
jgi:hypothetical protein